MVCSVGLKYAKNALAAGTPSRTPLGSSRRSPQPLVGWGGAHTLPIPHPLGAFGASILAPSALRSSCPPRGSLVPPAVLELATVLPCVRIHDK